MRRHGGLRLAVGEEFSSVQEFSAFLNAGVIDYARVDIALVGGFGAARRVAALCEAQNIPLMPHNPLAPVGFAALLHYATATPNLACVELQMANDVSPDLDAVFLLRPRPDKGFAVAGDAPGLGIEIDEASLPGPGHWRAPILEADDGGPVPW
jgi:galactonate dehydratase